LLLANATPQRVTYHVSGQLWADLLPRAGYFSEVVLFMDCSRQWVLAAPLRVPPFLLPDASRAVESRFFAAVATKWSHSVRERAIDGRPCGVFTTALLTGLKGAACDPAGRITANSLRTYLYLETKTFLPEESLSDPDIVKEPEIHYSGPSDDFILLEL